MTNCSENYVSLDQHQVTAVSHPHVLLPFCCHDREDLLALIMLSIAWFQQVVVSNTNTFSAHALERCDVFCTKTLFSRYQICIKTGFLFSNSQITSKNEMVRREMDRYIVQIHK